MWQSPLVSFPALIQLNRTLLPLLCSPANSFKFQSCDRTPQAARLTTSLRHWMPTEDPQHQARSVYTLDYPGI